MDSWGGRFDQILFAVLPYLSILTFLLVTIQRYRHQSFSYSSLSSQFLENRHHFWGLVPFHYGILAVTAGHLAGFLLPEHLLAWNSVPARLYATEIGGLVFALLATLGLSAGMVRRWTDPKVRVVTSTSDWIICWMLLAQMVSGIGIAVFYSWGSSWFAASAAPYLWSLVTLAPEIQYVASMPWLVKAHVVGAFVLIGFFPFTRLVHILVIPNPYLWRRPQVVRWWRKTPAA